MSIIAEVLVNHKGLYVNRLPIDNVRDPDATTLLAAHVGYWKNPTVFRTIVENLLCLIVRSQSSQNAG